MKIRSKAPGADVVRLWPSSVISGGLFRWISWFDSVESILLIMTMASSIPPNVVRLSKDCGDAGRDGL